MTRDDVVALLRRENPGARADDVALYADCFLDYQEAIINIREQGSIVIHPRTGAPIDNPYLKVRMQAMAGILKLRRIKKTAVLWNVENAF